MSYEHGNVIQADSPAPGITAPRPKPILTRRQKLWRFLIGFLGWWLVNGLVVGASSWGEVFGFYEAYHFLVLVLLPGNVLTFVLLAIVNRWVALGFAGAFVSLFVFIYLRDWIYFTFFWR